MDPLILKTFENVQQSIKKATPQQLQLPAFYQQIHQLLINSDFDFLAQLAQFLHPDDFYEFIKTQKIQKVNEGQLLVKGSKINKGYVLLNGRVEFHHHFDNSQITQFIGLLAPGRILCPDSIVSGKGAPYSVFCCEQCQFMVISAEKFSKYVKKYQIKQLDEQIEFLKRTVLFSDVNQQIIRKYYPYLTSKKHGFKQNIYEENQQAEFFYLIEQGNVELRKKIMKQKAVPQNFTKTSKISEIKLVNLSRGEFFGQLLKRGSFHKESAFCLSQKVHVLMMKKLIFDEMCQYAENIRSNILNHSKKIQRIHEQIAQRGSQTWYRRTNSDGKMRKKKRKKQKKNIGLQQIKWWGLVQNVKISEKYRLPKPQPLRQICSRTCKDQDENIQKISMQKKIDGLKKRILKGEIDDLKNNQQFRQSKQNIYQTNYSPWNTSIFPKTKIKIKMLDVKPKAIDLSEATKKKLITYAKNSSNFCDRLNLE